MVGWARSGSAHGVGLQTDESLLKVRIGGGESTNETEGRRANVGKERLLCEKSPSAAANNVSGSRFLGLSSCPPDKERCRGFGSCDWTGEADEELVRRLLWPRLFCCPGVTLLMLRRLLLKRKNRLRLE